MTDDFWAITSYYNPVGYRSRLENFRQFRRALDAPLIVAELSNRNRFEVPSDSRTKVLRISEGDIMWQKEALLNVALDHLPATAKYVAWLDCDVLFEQVAWREAARDYLSKFPLVQLFTDLHDFPEQSAAVDWLPPKTGRSVAAMQAQGNELHTAFRPSETVHMRQSSFGLAWAARVELMREHRFYDAMIIGSGDRALACAAFGRWEDASRSLKLLPARAAHYESWAKQFHTSVRGAVGVLPGRILHLWHGDISDRGYAERHARFSEIAFDPLEDLVRAPGGVWKWARQRSDLPQFMSEYFISRREDRQVAT